MPATTRLLGRRSVATTATTGIASAGRNSLLPRRRARATYSATVGATCRPGATRRSPAMHAPSRSRRRRSRPAAAGRRRGTPARRSPRRTRCRSAADACGRAAVITATQASTSAGQDVQVGEREDHAARLLRRRSLALRVAHLARQRARRGDTGGTRGRRTRSRPSAGPRTRRCSGSTSMPALVQEGRDQHDRAEGDEDVLAEEQPDVVGGRGQRAQLVADAIGQRAVAGLGGALGHRRDQRPHHLHVAAQAGQADARPRARAPPGRRSATGRRSRCGSAGSTPARAGAGRGARAGRWWPAAGGWPA